MPSTYIGPIEDAIAQQLLSLQAQGLKIDNSPASGMATPSARALIYLNTIDPVNRPSSGGSQPHAMGFEISLEMTDQRTHQKAYPFIEGILDLLNGHRVNGSIIRFDGSQFQSTADKDGIRWRYLLRFSLTTMWIDPRRR